MLFAEGDVGNALWMVLEGTVAINKEVDSGSPPITLVELTGGKWFGEIALAGSQVRSASAVTTTPAIFLILTRQKFDELAMAMPDVAEEMKRVIGDRMASTLQQVPLFSVLPESTLNLLAGLFEFVQYRPDEVIFSAGEAGHDFYIVIAGSVKVGLNLGAADGTEKIFCTMGESEFFGEIALLHSCKRTASVTSVDNCTMLKLNRVQFERFRRAVPSMEGPFRREATMRLTRTLKRDCELFRAYWENPHAWSAERKATHSAAAIAAATAPPKKEGEKKKKGRKKTTILFRAKSKKLKEELAAAAAEEKATAAAAAEAQKNPAGDDDHLLSSLFESRQVSQGGMIAEHGADEPEFMVVVSGSAVCTVPSSASGASIEVRRLKKGDWIGDTLLLRRAERVESVRALEDTVLISLDAKNLALLTRCVLPFACRALSPAFFAAAANISPSLPPQCSSRALRLPLSLSLPCALRARWAALASSLAFCDPLTRARTLTPSLSLSRLSLPLSARACAQSVASGEDAAGEERERAAGDGRQSALRTECLCRALRTARCCGGEHRGGRQRGRSAVRSAGDGGR